jgi:kumamolisin
MGTPMYIKQSSLRGFRWIAAILLAASLLPARALAQGEVMLPDSVKPVEQAPAGVGAGALDPVRPFVTRNTLKDAEAAAPLEFEVALKMRNFPELQARIAAGGRVSPQEMAARYEPLAADYDAVTAWLTTQGLTITHRDSHHMAIFVRGKINQVQQALHTSFARVSVHGQEYTSAITAPSVPAALSPRLLGINGLQPHIRAHKHIIRRQALPNAESGGASYFPAQIASAYHATALYNSKLTGSGEAIAIVIDTFPAASDLEAFWKDAGISQSIQNISFIQVVTGELPAPSGEETLDTEWSSSIAPGAKVRVYAATDLEDSDLDECYNQVYEDVTKHPDLGIHQMSMSYGEGEQSTTLGQVETDDQYFAELASAGVTIFASSGDEGSTPDANGGEHGSVQVESPASDPNVTGVGGTTLVLGATNNITSEVVWNNSGSASGGGFSEYFSRPSWQTGTGVVGGNRQVPDVAASADPEYGAQIVLQSDLQTVGGTSWSSPTWAGFCALINQARTGAGQSAIGMLGPRIYPLLSAPNYPTKYHADFNDITSGNNATRNSGGEYDATPGFDLCTGLGTPQVQPLAQLLAASSGLVGIQMPAAVVSVVPGQNATFTVTVTGSAATYQWQGMPIGSSTWTGLSDGITYGGVTGPTLTVSDVTADMSGDQYQCIVTIGTNSVTTTPPSILVVDTLLNVSTLAGEAGVTGLANGLAGQGTTAQFNYPSGIAIDGSGNLYIADYTNNEIREIAPDSTVSTPYGSLSGQAGATNAAGNSALFNTPNAIASDGSGNLYVADTGNNLIRKISGGVVSTFPGTNDQFNTPEGITVDGSGNVYVADTGNDTIRKITPGGTVSVLAGQTGEAGYQDGVATTTALFNGPSSVAVDNFGNVYVADMGNSVVRKISAGMVTTIAGQAGETGYLDGLSGKSLFNAPFGVAVDSVGNLYIADALAPAVDSADAGNNVLRELSPTGVVSTIAGQVGTTGTDDGTGSAAQFFSLQAVEVSSTGQFYLADTYNQTIRMGGPAETRIIALSGTLAFGDVTAEQTASSTLTITNTGNTTLTVTKITYPAGFSGNWPSGVIAAGDSQDVMVTFAPTAAIHYGGNIVVASDATGGSDFIATSGTGLPAPVVPTVTTSPATIITASSATLNGSTNPRGSATTVYFQYGPTVSYTSTTGSLAAGGGAAAVPFTTSVGGLASHTPYHFRAVASNVAGTVYGIDSTFTTLAAPVIGGSSAVYLGAADVQVAETANPNGVSTSVYFQYGTSLSFGSRTASQSIGAGVAAINVSALFPGLAPNTPYYFQLVTTGAAGTFYGPVETFTTLGFDTELVVATGDPAAGVTGAEFSTFGNPAVNDQDYVAFQSVLLTGTAYGGVTTANDSGIWAEDNTATLQLAARIASAAPGTSGTFLTLTNPVYNHSESVAFVGTLKVATGQATAATATGVWSTSSGSLALVARQGSQAPGCPTGATFGIFDALSLPDQGGVLLLGTLNLNSTAKVTAANSEGIWAGDSTADLQLVVRDGDLYNGHILTNIAFLPALTYVNGQTRSFAQGSGDFVFRASLSNTTTGVFEVSGSTLQSVALSKESAPGVTAGQFSAFGNPAINANDDVAFAGTLTTGTAFGGVTTSDNSGIWADDNTGTLLLIARTAAAAPGTSGTFLTLSDPVYNDNEAVAFSGALKIATGQATSLTAAGVWSNSGGSLALVARQGSQAPGCLAGATFAAFTSVALPDQGGVILLATLNLNAAAGVTAANQTGIWAVDTSGNLQLIVRTGDFLNGKTITALSFMPVVSYAGGQTRNFNQGTGDLVYEATFSDKSNGIFEVIFP